MKGRALTPEKKRAVIEQLYATWLALPQLRLGQLIDNAVHLYGQTDLFNTEDEELVELAKKLTQLNEVKT